MSSENQVRGIVRAVKTRMENEGTSALKLAGKAAKLPLYLIPGYIDVQVRKRPKPPKQRHVWNFILEIKDKSNLPNHGEFLAVEMSGRKTRGELRDGDDVLVTGRLDKKDNVFRAKYVESTHTGERIYLK